MGACEILVRNLILGVGLVALAVLFSYVDALPSTERMIAKMSFATSATPPTTVAPAAPTAAPSTSLEAYKDLYASSEVKCMITQSGRDGIGHQLEGKLSCIAMASFVGLDYIHKPFYTMQHVRDPAKMAAFFENFFGLSTQFRLLNSSTMKERRQVVPWVGKCWQNGWLRLVEKGNLTCKKDGQDLVSMDNCWDRMYCHGYMESGHWYKLVPHIHAAYFSSEKPDPQWTEGFAEQTWGPKVAVHIRRGDSGYQLKLSWYARQIESLRQRFCSEGKPPPLFRVQTDEEKVQNLIKAEPRLEASDIVLDGRSSSLELAIHRMIIADAFITSRSSLSMSMALIGNQSIVIMPNCYERTSLPHWTRAACDEK